MCLLVVMHKIIGFQPCLKPLRVRPVEVGTTVIVPVSVWRRGGVYEYECDEKN